MFVVIMCTVLDASASQSFVCFVCPLVLSDCYEGVLMADAQQSLLLVSELSHITYRVPRTQCAYPVQPRHVLLVERLGSCALLLLTCLLVGVSEGAAGVQLPCCIPQSRVLMR